MAAVLVVEDDRDIRQVVEALLREEGYDVAAAAPQAARDLVDARTFAFILTDLSHLRGSNRPDDPLAVARELLARASPTPVGIMTAWPLDEKDVTAQGFACLIPKPFDVDFLLACVARGVQAPLTEEEERQADTVRAYFAALAGGDFAAVGERCTDDVRFVAPRIGMEPLVLASRAEYIAYAAARREDFPDVRFEDVRIYGMPRRLAARFEMRWRREDGTDGSQAGAALFQFADDGRIRRIGLDLNVERLWRIAPLPHVANYY